MNQTARIVLQKIHDYGLVVHWYHRSPTPTYGNGEIMPHHEWLALQYDLGKDKQVYIVETSGLLEATIWQSEYVQRVQLPPEEGADEEFAGIRLRYTVTEKGLEQLKKKP